MGQHRPPAHKRDSSILKAVIQRQTCFTRVTQNDGCVCRATPASSAPKSIIFYLQVRKPACSQTSFTEVSLVSQHIPYHHMLLNLHQMLLHLHQMLLNTEPPPGARVSTQDGSRSSQHQPKAFAASPAAHLERRGGCKAGAPALCPVEVGTAWAAGQQEGVCWPRAQLPAQPASSGLGGCVGAGR